MSHIPKRNQEHLKTDLNEIDSASEINRENCGHTCDNIITALKNTIHKYTQLKH